MHPMQLLQKAKQDAAKEIALCDAEIEHFRKMWVEGLTQYKDWQKAREKAVHERDAYDDALQIMRQGSYR